MDEPTTGVDPVSRRDFWLILAQVLKDGVSIVVSTPYLDEAERCSQVGLLSAGRLLASDTPAGMHKRMAGYIVEFTVSDVRAAADVLPQEPVSWCLEVQLFGDRIHVRCEDVEHSIQQLSARLLKAGVEIFDARQVTPSLENIFLSMLYREKATNDEQ